MKNKNLILNLVIVGMTLGTSWAIRGQFGHEQGAAWAGAIGAICIIFISGRQDWYNKLFKASMAAAIGWGLGGMMSYGVVVGYGRGVDFINVYYGLLMLFIIGGLYGFIGGGLFGLVLQESKTNRVRWGVLMSGLVTGGIIAYFFLILQWEWKMTPPRSELWAACLGAALFLAWFTQYFQYKSALRVALFSGLGGGFGFAFGNFLQVMGNVSEIPFNFWNVMEYSLGFFGGLGMAYGTYTSKWEDSASLQKKESNIIPILFLVFFIPLVIWDQTFSIEKIAGNYEKLIGGEALEMAWVIKVVALILILAHTAFIMIRYYHIKTDEMIQYSAKEVKLFFGGHFALYMLFSLIITGAIVSFHRIEQYLYIVNYILILLVLPGLKPVFRQKATDINWARKFVIVFIILVLLAIVLINAHGEMPGMQKRFEF